MERIGLIAGNGTFPLIFAREAAARGTAVTAVAHLGETLVDLESEVDEVAWLHVGEVGKMIRVLKEAGVRRAVMAGGVDKARSLASIKPDDRGLELLAKVTGRGDDALLRALADELAAEGIEVVASTLFLERILARSGLIAGRRPPTAALADVRLGVRVLAATGPFDVGQSVVVENGVVLAIEAIEGTDAAIRRGAGLGRGGAVVVKAAKPGQDMRFDVPAIGPTTIETMAAAGATSLAVEAGACIVLDLERVQDLTRRHEVSVVGYTGQGEVADG